MDSIAKLRPNPLLTTAELAARPDFELGEATICPSTRTVRGPGGEADLEPRVMQVLVVLADAAGAVVTRETLFDRCWGNSLVGDDSLNRAIAGVRRIAENIAGGSFEIETVPRTGYKLVVGSGAGTNQAGQTGKNPPTRRALIGGALAATGAGAIGSWAWLRDRPNPRFEALMQRGEEALRLDEPEAAKYFEQAVAIEPRNAKSLGLLAYALASGRDGGPLAVDGETALAAERAARTALNILPNESNALLAMALLQLATMDRISREQQLRQILAIDPRNVRAMAGLGAMLHGVGRCRESLSWAERALAIEPLTPDLQRRKAMALWVVGRVAEADHLTDRAMGQWPAHRLIRMARLMIYAFTDRPRAALAIVEEEEANPILLSPAAVSVWRVSLAALETRSPSDVAAARAANLDGAKSEKPIAAYAIPILSALGEIAAAFDVADGFLLGRGSVVIAARPGEQVLSARNAGWRNTYGLFIPPTKAMRHHPRFKSLADGLGLTEYWRKRGIGPDAFLFER